MLNNFVGQVSQELLQGESMDMSHHLEEVIEEIDEAHSNDSYKTFSDQLLNQSIP
jgi:hypothetical protein